MTVIRWKASLLLTLLVLFFRVEVYSQYNPSALINSLSVPNTPETQAFINYGNTPVDLYTGKPSIQIPIYNHQGREFSLPVNLTYDAGGVKVEQMATGIGLSWNLNAGGRISRIMNGSPDDAIAREYLSILDHEPGLEIPQKILKYMGKTGSRETFESIQAARDYLNFLQQVSRGDIDTQPDIYALYAPGISNHFIYDIKKRKMVPLNNPNVKAEPTFGTKGNKGIEKWIITNDDGTRYHFEAHETTEFRGDDYRLKLSGGTAPQSGVKGLKKDYYSAWLLTKIESANKLDVYVFSYQNNDSWDESGNLADAVMNINILDKNSKVNVYPEGSGEEVRFRPTVRVNQPVLKSISHNGEKVLELVLTSRHDSNVDTRIEKINIYGPGPVLVKQYRLAHSYFGIPKTADPSRYKAPMLRLKLDAIHIGDGTSTNFNNTYRFTYYKPEEIPATHSLSQDYLGLYNGKQNTVLYPRYKSGSGDIYNGADRSPDFSKTRVGMLEEIQYPTKGSTRFVYEKNGPQLKSFSKDILTRIAQVDLKGGVASKAETEIHCQGAAGLCADEFGAGKYPKILINHLYIKKKGTYYLRYISGGQHTRAWLIRKANATPVPFLAAAQGGNITWSNFNSGHIEKQAIELEAGYYQLMVSNPTAGSHIHFAVREKKTIRETIRLREYAGIRIREISDYDAAGNRARQRMFRYTTSITGEESSREVNYSPMSQLAKLEFDGKNAVLRRSVNGVSSNQPYITYSRVYEVETGNGYTEYNFNTKESGLRTDIVNGTSYYAADFGGGKDTLRKVYDAGGKTLLEVKNKYTGYYHDGGSKSFFTGQKPSFFGHFPRIKPENGKYRLDRIPGENWCYSGISFGKGGGSCDQALQPPKQGCEPPNVCLQSYEEMNQSSITQLILASSGGYELPLEVTTTKYGVGGVTSSQEVQKNIYDATYYQLRKQEVTTSETGKNLVTEYEYTTDRTGPVYDWARSKNMIKSVVGQKQYRKDQLLFTTENTYTKNVDALLPVFTLQSKGSHSLEKRRKYFYDDKQNLVQVSVLGNDPNDLSSAVNETYLRGYKNTYVVAKVQNATYAEVVNLLGAERIKSIRDQVHPASALKNLLAPLFNLPNAQVMLYVYKPGIGVIEMVDANGQKNTYEYDGLGRLIRVRDFEGNTVAEHQYHLIAK